MLIGTIWIIIIEILRKRTFEDVLFFCVMKMRFMVGVENQEIEKNPLVIISKRGEKPGKVEKYPARGKQAGEKVEKHEKTQSEESKRGEKVEKREKNPAGGMQVG